MPPRLLKFLMKIFKVVERDEPSHWEPYEDWLRTRGLPQARLRDRARR